MKKCKNCQSEFQPKTYNQTCCSQKCQNTRNQRNYRNNNSKICPTCKNPMYFRSTKCRTCTVSDLKEQIQELTIFELQTKESVKNKHPSWINAEIRNFCRSWNKDLLNCSCQNCNYNKHVELCHIKAVSKFDKNTKIKIVNAPENILVLCRNCHWEFDNNILKLKEIKPRKMVSLSGVAPESHRLEGEALSI